MRKNCEPLVDGPALAICEIACVFHRANLETV